MLLRQLDCFAEVVDAESFTRAAARCHISQPAMSQQIKALEQELGCELVHRAGKTFAVTPAGELVHAAAHDVRRRIDRLKLDLEREREGERGGKALTVGYLNRYEGWEVQSAVAAFTLRHPEVTVSAVGGSHEGLYELLMSGGVHMAFSDRRRELSDEFVNEYLLTLFTSIEVSEANPLAAYDEVAVSQLAEVPCILIARPEQRAAERNYYRDVLNFPCPFVFATSRDEAHMMVAGNRGFLPVESREPRAATGSVIKRVPLVNASGQLRRDYYAFWLKRRTNWLVKEFARILADLIAG